MFLEHYRISSGNSHDRSRDFQPGCWSRTVGYEAVDKIVFQGLMS